MLIIILIISFYLAGILFYIQSKPPTQKITKSLFWPVYSIKDLFEKKKWLRKKMKTPNFEKEIQVLVQKLEDDKYAQAFYAALCNTEWKKLNTNYVYSCSWRYAGGLVAGMRYKGENYLDFYCSGNEGKVRENIEKDLNTLEYIRVEEA